MLDNVLLSLQKRVMLGSDYPFPLGEHHPGKLIESIDDMDDDTKVRLIINTRNKRFSVFCCRIN